MLELRPNCELCNLDLPPACENAFICTYECTYCENCVKTVLHDVCPTCGGNFSRRPIRPGKSWRPEKRLGLGYHPASPVRRHSKFTSEEILEHVERLRQITPQDR